MRNLQKYIIVITFLLFVTPVNARGNLPDFTNLVAENHLAVVNISTLTHISQPARPIIPRSPNGSDLDDSPLGEFLRKFLEQSPEHGGGRPREFDSKSSGSGFIISSDGYVLTNNHVVESADEVTVRLTDRRQYIAKVVGTDKRSDIAVLKIDAVNLPFVKTGTADNLKVGEWVLAIGSPFGFDFSVTAGIVSAKRRSLPNESYVPFIQTDVAINPGNSGGPLFNMKGEVVGVNSQIYSRSGGFMGLSFAIPIEIAMEVADQLKQGGSVARGWLGVVIQEVTRDLAESFSMDKAYGALVSRILRDSPAADSDLKIGDVIISFNGKSVERSASLPPIVGRSPLNKPADVEIIRNGKKQLLSVVIGELPSDEELMNAASGGKSNKKALKNPLKLSVTDLDKETLAKMGLEGPAVVVSNVESGPAEQAGVLTGDVIVTVDNKAIVSAETFYEIVAALETGRTVPILVQREQGPVFLAIKIP